MTHAPWQVFFFFCVCRLVFNHFTVSRKTNPKKESLPHRALHREFPPPPPPPPPLDALLARSTNDPGQDSEQETSLISHGGKNESTLQPFGPLQPLPPLPKTKQNKNDPIPIAHRDDLRPSLQGDEVGHSAKADEADREEDEQLRANANSES